MKKDITETNYRQNISVEKRQSLVKKKRNISVVWLRRRNGHRKVSNTNLADKLGINICRFYNLKHTIDLSYKSFCIGFSFIFI